jgi:hypothetical protein
MAAQNSTTKTTEAARRASEAETEMAPCQDMTQYLRDYARAQPEMAALWCLGIGFVLGWKLKPW